jgi:hypothetical protein
MEGDDVWPRVPTRLGAGRRRRSPDVRVGWVVTLPFPARRPGGRLRPGVPVRVEYRVMADGAGLTSAVHVRDQRGFETRTIALTRDARGGWTLDGKAAPALKRCTDVDLGCSPSTNTLPIRRLRLGIGASHTIQAAWVRFPELTVVKAAQTYTRLDEFTYRYASGDSQAELTVDDEGAVTAYAVWQRTGISMGPDDTEPLDTHR